MVRVGCFCNIGACQNALNFTDEDVISNHKAGHVCGDDVDLVNGKPTGSIRVSFGYYSSQGKILRKLILLSEKVFPFNLVSCYYRDNYLLQVMQTR